MRIEEGWKHLHFEAHCGRNWSPKRYKYRYSLISTKPFKTKKILNPDYDPNFKFQKKPMFCEHLSFTCYEKKCPYLLLSPCEIGDCKMFDKAFNAQVKKENGAKQ